MVSIPDHVLRLMWEYDQEALTTSSELPDAVIERIMSHGRWSDMKWLMETASSARLLSYLHARGSRVLPARELAFWAFACDVPEATAAHWRQDARQREREWRG